MCDAVCNGCDNVNCEHTTLCVILSWEEPDGFRQGNDMIQSMILKESVLWLQSGRGGPVGGAKRRRADSRRLLQPPRQEMVVPGLRGGQSWREMDKPWRYSQVEMTELADELEDEPEGKREDGCQVSGLKNQGMVGGDVTGMGKDSGKVRVHGMGEDKEAETDRPVSDVSQTSR